MSVRVQQAAFDPGAELNALHAANLGIGAVVGFVGYVRDFNDGHEVAGMFLEHAPGMTEKALQKIVAEAEQRWSLASRSFSSAWPARIAKRRSMPAASSWIT